MKKFNASELSNNRSEVMKAARNGGAIIQEKRTNGELVCEYVLVAKRHLHSGNGELIKFSEYEL